MGALRRGLIAVALLAALAAAVLPRRRPPDVVLVVVDTLRADHVGVTGGRSGLTPFLDRLGATGTVFRNAYSTSSWTNPAVASLFTSRYPSQHQVTRFESRLPVAELTLAERLAAAGWWSMGQSANFRLVEAAGYGQGFAVWRAHLTGRHGKVRAKQVASDTIGFYDEFFAPVRRTRWTRRTRPVFLYLHLMEPHAPYDPPEHLRRRLAGPPPAGRTDAAANAALVDVTRWSAIGDDEVTRLADLYAAEVAEVDRRLERLFAALRARGLLDHAVVVVTADHGEEFREHGGLLHGTALHEESVRVPLLISGPGVPAGRVVDDEVSLVDVAPTILALAELPPEPRFEGRSLLGPAPETGALLQLFPIGAGPDARRHVAGAVHARQKVLVPPGAGAAVHYDLAEDPGERSPAPAPAELTARLDDRQRALAARAGAAESAPVDADLRDRLRALGYSD